MRLLPKTYWLIAAFSIIIAVLFYYKGESNILFFDFHNFPDNAGLTTMDIYIHQLISLYGGRILHYLWAFHQKLATYSYPTAHLQEDYPMLRYMAIPTVAWSVSSEFFTFCLI